MEVVLEIDLDSGRVEADLTRIDAAYWRARKDDLLASARARGKAVWTLDDLEALRQRLEAPEAPGAPEFEDAFDLASEPAVEPEQESEPPPPHRVIRLDDGRTLKEIIAPADGSWIALPSAANWTYPVDCTAERRGGRVWVRKPQPAELWAALHALKAALIAALPAPMTALLDIGESLHPAPLRLRVRRLDKPLTAPDAVIDVPMTEPEALAADADRVIARLFGVWRDLARAEVDSDDPDLLWLPLDDREPPAVACRMSDGTRRYRI